MFLVDEDDSSLSKTVPSNLEVIACQIFNDDSDINESKKI